MTKKKYKRTCILKGCNVKFEPMSTNHVACSWQHGIEYAKTALKKNAKQEEKNWKKEKKERKEKLKTRTDHLNELQAIFNKFIRLRDAKLGCISCGCELKGKYDAGHFFSVGTHPELRFWEDNCHGQCVYCNQHRHGNLLEYAVNLPKRIGVDRHSILLAAKGSYLKLTLPEILDKKEYYKQKIKHLK